MLLRTTFLLFFLISCAGAQSTIRGLKDTVGFAISAKQMDAVIAHSRSAESEQLAANAAKYGLTTSSRYIAAISPHDDYITAGRVYAHIYPYIKAKRVVIFGVAHYARRRHVRNKLIFDSHAQWHGPYAPVTVSGVREELLSLLPPRDVLISDEMQVEEHSVEALIPWLQFYNREVKIVSILIPGMRFSHMDSLSAKLADAVTQIIHAHDWRLGEDIAFLFSNDGSHYGDQGWGGKNYAPFGVDCEGLAKAMNRDRNLTRETLCGEITSEKAHEFYRRVLAPEDFDVYQITWCGRFAVPFGVNFLAHLANRLDRQPFTGDFLRYDNSVSLGELDLRALGLGLTSPVNLHHWVGYAAVGYR